MQSPRNLDQLITRREWGSPVQTIEKCLRRASNAEREPKKRAGERRAATIEAEGR